MEFMAGYIIYCVPEALMMSPRWALNPTPKALATDSPLTSY